jgi:CubicO group peptidase (beta-lactamase class C family)
VTTNRRRRYVTTLDVMGAARTGADLAGLLDEVLQPFPATDPGVAVGVYVNGALAAHASRGLASVEHQVPVGPRTPFDIASVSKQMTAACALLLAEDGLVDLDADVRELLPELPVAGVTLRSCLHHTAGLHDYMAVNELLGGSLCDMRGEREFLAWLASTTSTEFAPGTDVSYSNTGYVAVAAALSRATSRPFGALMRERVFDPLGMSDTTLHDRVGRVVPALAFSYLRDPEHGLLRVEMPEEQVGDGAVLTTLVDLAGWHGFLHDGRGLGQVVRERLLAPAVLTDGRTTRYGAGLMLTEVGGHVAVEHSGHMYAYGSHLIAVPDAGIGVTVLANLSGTDATAMAHEVVRAAMGQTRSLPPVPRTADEVEAGTWWATETNHLLQLQRLGPGSLLLKGHGPEPVGLVDDGTGAFVSTFRGLRLTTSATGTRLRDRLGRVLHLERVVPGPLASGTLDGCYRSGALGTVRIRLTNGAALVLIGRAEPVRLRHAGRAGCDEVFVGDATDVRLRQHVADGTVTIASESTVLSRLPRVEQQPPERVPRRRVLRTTGAPWA